MKCLKREKSCNNTVVVAGGESLGGGWEGRQTKGGRRFGPYVKIRQEPRRVSGSSMEWISETL